MLAEAALLVAAADSIYVVSGGLPSTHYIQECMIF